MPLFLSVSYLEVVDVKFQNIHLKPRALRGLSYIVNINYHYEKTFTTSCPYQPWKDEWLSQLWRNSSFELKSTGFVIMHHNQ